MQPTAPAAATSTDGDGGPDAGTRDPLLLLLASLWAGDALFAMLHMVQALVPRLLSPDFSLGTDGGHSEWFQYAKAAAVCAMLMLLYRAARQAVLLAWAALFLYVLFDDSLRFHETWGHALVGYLAIPSVFGLRGQDLGELAVIALAGATLLPGLALAHRRAMPWVRELSRDLMLLLMALLAFGVGVDILHAWLSPWRISHLVGLLEDSGEMFVMSLVVYYLAQHLRGPGTREVRFSPQRWIGKRLMRALGAVPQR